MNLGIKFRPKALVVINSIININGIHDVNIFLEDGSVAYYYHNEEHICLKLFQSRLQNLMLSNQEIWYNLSEGKVYYKDFPAKKSISRNMIIEAIDWLCFPNRNFHIIQIRTHDYENIIEVINNFIINKEIPPRQVKFFRFN